MSGLTDPIVLAAMVAAVPGTVAAILSQVGNRRAKRTIVIAKENTTKLDKLGNGILDEKIRRAVGDVLDERGHRVTEAFITDVFQKVLTKHLEE